MEELIESLYEITSLEELEEWKKDNGAEVKRSLQKEHKEELTKVFKDVEAKLKEEANG